MAQAELQLWLAKHDTKSIVYDWVTIDNIEYLENQNVELLKERIRVAATEHKPFINAARLRFPTGSHVTITDVW